MQDDKAYLLQTLALAQHQRGFSAPRPSVGAIIVKDENILAEGYFQEATHAHAEIDALNKLNHAAHGATAYVSLEPCCHTGRTPPCTDALIKAGITRVVYGYRDPNPVVAGKGEAVLCAVGITCEYLPLPEIIDFYRSYTHWWSTKTPWVTAKLALTQNGMIAASNGDPLAITGKPLQTYTHERRKVADAILTTIETVLHDDPRLNVRLEGKEISKPIYVLDSQLRLPLNATLHQTAKHLTVFHAEGAPEAQKTALTIQGVRCIAVSQGPQGLDLNDILKHIGQDGVHDLWVEAGSRLFNTLHRQERVNQTLLYVAPHSLAEGKAAFPGGFTHDFDQQNTAWQSVGKDVLLEIIW